jgi:hypothetical protein
MPTRRLGALLFVLSAACGSARPSVDPQDWRAAAPSPSVAVAAPEPECDGMRIALFVNDDPDHPDQTTSRRLELTCHASGATLTYDANLGPEIEGSSESVELTVDEATALWAELRLVSLAALACGHAAGARSHRIEIEGGHALRIVECDAAETPAAWTELESLLRPRRGGDDAWSTDDGELWQFDGEHWRDELGYARSSPRPES